MLGKVHKHDEKVEDCIDDVDSIPESKVVSSLFNFLPLEVLTECLVKIKTQKAAK